jgi:hypothetical protein
MLSVYRGYWFSPLPFPAKMQKNQPPNATNSRTTPDASAKKMVDKSRHPFLNEELTTPCPLLFREGENRGVGFFPSQA